MYVIMFFMQLNDSIKDEILANQRMVPPGKSLMALNGALINIEDIDLYMYLSFLSFFNHIKLDIALFDCILIFLHKV